MIHIYSLLQVMLAIKRLKDIKSGKKFSSTLPPHPTMAPHHQEIVVINRDCPTSGNDAYQSLVGDFRTFSGQRTNSNTGNECYSPRQPHNETYNQPGNYSQNINGGGQYNPNGAQFSPSVFRSYVGHHPNAIPGSPLHRQNSNSSTTSHSNTSVNQQQHNPYAVNNNQGVHSAVQYRPDFVPVQVHPQIRRSKDGMFEEPIYSTFHPDSNRFSQYQQQQLQQQSNQFSSLPPRPNLPLNNTSYPPRSLDDGDITPTNEMISYEGGGGATLPRHRNAANNKYRPVAKVTAKTRVEVHHEMSHKDEKPPPLQTSISNQKEDIEKFVKENNINNSGGVPTSIIANNSSSKIENIYNVMHAHSTNNTPQGTPKKLPPPPPRRSNSISESSKLESLNNSNMKNSFQKPLPVSAPQSSNNTSNSNSCQNRESQYGFLKRGMNYGYMGVKNNLQPDVGDDLPPPPPAPHDVGNHQYIHHHPNHRRPQTQMIPHQVISIIVS